jgi:hypothetical protein
MKAKLIKDHQEYMLINDKRFVIATTDVSILKVTDKMKLSKQNCDSLFGVVDVEKLADFYGANAKGSVDFKFGSAQGFEDGFNKAMELNKDKVFTVEDMIEAMTLNRKNLWSQEEVIAHFTKQPTEIEVEIVMEKVVDETKMIGVVKGVKGSGNKITTYKSVPKLDENGCLILKKK